MVYSDQFVVVVKVNGQILREKDQNLITLPFGSEYSLLLKNLDSRTAGVSITIDGQDVLDGRKLVVLGNSETELKGFMDGNTVRNKFKFIQKTKEIQEHRGDKIDDGIIRVEFAYEKRRPIRAREIIWEYPFIYRGPYYTTYHNSTFDPKNSGVRESLKFASSSNVECSTRGLNNVQSDCELNVPNEDEGITVKGQEITQDFQKAYLASLEQSQVIIIKLRGIKSNGVQVEQPLTVKDKLTCSSCGRKWKSNQKYCGNCGTFLE